MTRQTEYRNRALRRDGFTMAECLIALAISAMLLTAIATAFNASLINYEANEELFQTINNARQALARMTGQLRTGSCVYPLAPANECSFFTSSNEDITYEFRSADNKLYLITNSDGNEYVLCDHVTAATFTKTPTADNSDCKSVQVLLTVQCGDTERTLSAAAVIRKNLTY
jgi:prepilin-type N-terminal cleavage/methylation domain-containing protein